MAIINERKLGIGSYAVSTKGITVTGLTKSYENIAERDADSDPGTFAYVRDASGDPTVKSGFAIYARKGKGWLKLFEQEAMDEDESSSYRVDWTKIINGPTVTPEAIDNAAITAHEHTNKEVLDQFGLNGTTITINGADATAKPAQYTKWMQLIRPISVTTPVHCLIHFYRLSSNPQAPGWELVRSVDSRIVDTSEQKNQGKFYYYDGNQFVNVTDTGFPADIAGRFIIVDVEDIVADGTLFIRYEWLDNDTEISNGVCVYPAITPTNTDSVGLTSMIEQTNWNTIS